MSQSDTHISRVLLLGCSELGRPLRHRGLSATTLHTVGQLLEPKEGFDARAIVLGGTYVESGKVRDLIPRLRTAWPLVDVLVWAPNVSPALVREILHAGARDVVLSSSADRCADKVTRTVESQQLLPRAALLGQEREQPSEFEGMASRSRRMWDLFDTATRIAPTDATVLILGDTGTGKELLARAIHNRSTRKGRFVAVNCGAVPESLVDSELFGHVEGAFTGATGRKEGLFRYADAGTLMLDEIGTIPEAAQHRLLRVLQEGTVRPVGGHEELPVDVRMVAATSSDLEREVERGRFREDLFYRLDVIRLQIPPLRERPEDIVFLFAIFARRIAEQYSIDRPNVSDDFLDALVEYEWPGNVRQLENFTEQLLLTHPNKKATAKSLRKLLPFRKSSAGASRPSRTVRAPGLGADSDLEIDPRKPLREVVEPHVEAVERAYLRACLREQGGRIGATAAQAGISRRTLLRKLQRYGIDKSRFRARGDRRDPDAAARTRGN